MLCNLNIKDLAVVSSLDLDFNSGLTVLTGETGAGKSILLTALGLALGDRADAGYIRPGAGKAEINLAFELKDAEGARSWLEENELLDEEETCFIRRVVSQDGRSKAYINNRPATLQSLQELASRLVEIHGQHAHLHLLQANEQRRILDESSGNQALLERLSTVYGNWLAVNTALEAAARRAQEGAAREELLRYQIEEMEQHDVDSLDYEALSEEQTLQANVGRILTSGQEQVELLYDDDSHSVNALLSQAVHALDELAHLAPEFGEIRSLLDDAKIQVKEAASELRRRLDKLEADPQRLIWLDDTLGLLHRLARKHQVSPQALREHLAALRQDLDGIEHGSERVGELQVEVARLETEYRQLAGELSVRRQQGAERLQSRISEIIRELGMPQGELWIQVHALSDDRPTPNGNDQIDFLVSANPGLPPRPLGKVASGGELSRISLAIQVAATDSKTTPTLIFDEVDTGIGGGVAEIVGQKLRALGAGRQVFCVTHLHQVAALGHHHLLVEKNNADGHTQTGVRALDPEQRKHEIARMLGGLKITDQTLAHAAELLAHS